jgi:hypothetical protein
MVARERNFQWLQQTDAEVEAGAAVSEMASATYTARRRTWAPKSGQVTAAIDTSSAARSVQPPSASARRIKCAVHGIQDFD